MKQRAPARRVPRVVALLLPLSIVIVLAACATWSVSPFDTLFGRPDPYRFDVPAPPPAGQSYLQTVQPILDRRCVVCHACYDAPCQLKTTRWEGLARGASKVPVYDATRLLAAEPSRLDEDAEKASDWRARGFFPVLNERAPTLEADRTAGLLHRMLTARQQHPLPTAGVLPGGNNFLTNQPASCPADAEIAGYERSTAYPGMPYALPGLSAGEHGVLTTWIEQGAPFEGHTPLPSAVLERIERWERFLNGDSAKERLVSRYLYEHLFLAHLHFDDVAPPGIYLKLVRSSTPPGTPVQRIVTRRPVDDPGVARVFYRLVPERETIVAKTHMPYALNERRMAFWRELFLQPGDEVATLPGYSAETAANPFATFAALPVQARYRFMLDEAEFTIMGFVKGPVCRGQMALDVIEDQFWVTFLAPSNAYDEAVADFLARHARTLALPTGRSNTDLLVTWLEYDRLEHEYRQAKTRALEKALRGPARLDLNLIWDGDGVNDNAALTIFRHFDSASVIKGLAGPPPKTAWVIGYPMLERIHYLLVADYDVYGNIGHQLNSRLYMDFLRMEGEFNFLTFLPRADRAAVRDQWYRGVGEGSRAQVYGGPATTLDVESAGPFRSADTKQELYGLLQHRLHHALAARRTRSLDTPPALRDAVASIERLRGAALQWIPEFALLQVELPDRSMQTYSLVRHTGHASVSHLLGEAAELRPDENTLTLMRGVVGSYPNVFYRVAASELPAMARAIGALRSEADYAAFAERWAVRRTNTDFWAVSDAFHDRYLRDQPREAGVLDYNRYENR